MHITASNALVGMIIFRMFLHAYCIVTSLHKLSHILPNSPASEEIIGFFFHFLQQPNLFLPIYNAI